MFVRKLKLFCLVFIAVMVTGLVATVQATPISGSTARTMVACTVPDMWNFPISAIQDLADAGVDLVELNLSMTEDNVGVMPSRGVYDFTGFDTLLERFGSRGMKAIINITPHFNIYEFPEYYSPYIDQNGKQLPIYTEYQRPNIYIDAFNNGFADYIQAAVSHYTNNSNVYGFYVSGPSYFGEVEMLVTDYSKPQFFCYDNYAKEKFRDYLKSVYPSLSALNTAWATAYANWSDVQPPLPDTTLSESQIDLRQSWSDFMIWRHKYLYDLEALWLGRAKANTSKPIGILIGGPKTGSSKQAGFSPSVGDMMKLLTSGGHPSMFDDTNVENVASIKYTATAAQKYGAELHAEQDGGLPSVTVNGERQTLGSLLMGGADVRTYSFIAHMFRGYDWDVANEGSLNRKPHWAGDFSKTEHYWNFKNIAKTMDTHKSPEKPKSDVAFFHSYYTPWYRGEYGNADVCKVYDRDLSSYTYNSFASWGRHLTTPDVVDEQMILDDFLADYKVLVIPNMFSTVVPQPVMDKIKNWVNNGGSLVTFGSGSLTYGIDSNRKLVSQNPNDPAYWNMGLSGGTTASSTNSTTWKVSGSMPSWLTSLTSSDQGSIASIEKVFTALAPGAVPVLEDGNGNKLMVEYSYGTGKVLFTTTKVENNSFFNDVIPKIISDFADSRNIKRYIKFDPSVAATYIGVNPVSSKHTFVVFDSQNYVSQNDGAARADQTFTFDSNLSGQAEILQISKYLANSWDVTVGTRNTMTDVVSTSFTLPNSVTLFRSTKPLQVFQVNVSSESPYWPGKNLINGMIGEGTDENGFWVSYSGMPQSFVLDLGKQRVCNAVKVSPRLGYGPKNVTVSVSNDNINFTNVWSGMLPDGNKLIYFDKPHKVEFVRLEISSTYSPDNNVQIREFEVFGPEAYDFPTKASPASVRYTTQESTNTAAKAFDGLESTYWSSTVLPGQNTPQWLIYDLGSEMTINRAELIPVINEGPGDLDICTSTDNIHFTPVYSFHNNNKSEIYSFSPIRARYIKLNIRSSYSANKVKVKEFTVYSTAVDTGNIREVPATAVMASSHADFFGFNVRGTLDGCTTSDNKGYWVSQSTPTAAKPEWLKYDFGKVQTINKIAIRPRVNFGNKGTEVQISTDGIIYTTIYNGTASNGDLIVDFNTTGVRFVNIIFKTSYSADNVQIKEVEFFGPVVAGTHEQLDISSISATSTHGSYVSSNLIDGLYNNNLGFWVGNTPSESSPEIITADLGAARTVSKVAIDTRMGAYAIGPGEVIILTSNDGVKYSQATSGYLTNERGLLEFTPVTARYVKVYMKSTYSPDSNNQINEIKVFGN